MNKYLKILLVIATTVALQLSLLAAISTISWKASNFLAFWICVAILAQIIKVFIQNYQLNLALFSKPSALKKSSNEYNQSTARNL